MNKLVCTLLLLCCSQLLQAEDPQQRTQREWETAQKIQELMQAGKEAEAMKLYETLVRDSFSGKLQVAGQVVDEAGQPLNDVIMVITRLEYDSLQGTDLKEINDKKTINGRFAYACEECAGARLQFKKDGYYRDSVEFVTYADETPTRELVKNDVTVTLVKMGKRVGLHRYSGNLKATSSGAVVLPLSFGQTTRAERFDQLDDLAKHYKYEGEVAYVELRVKRDDNLMIAIQEVEQSGSRSKLRKPVDPVLDLTAADGGIQLYQPKHSKVRKIDLEMRRAPEDGYQPTLKLDVDNNEEQYFYCRIGEHYGRGRLSSVRINRDSQGDYANLNISIRLNPTPGDTNLE